MTGWYEYKIILSKTNAINQIDWAFYKGFILMICATANINFTKKIKIKF
jgi:hypothetical protein